MLRYGRKWTLWRLVVGSCDSSGGALGVRASWAVGPCYSCPRGCSSRGGAATACSGSDPAGEHDPHKLLELSGVSIRASHAASVNARAASALVSSPIGPRCRPHDQIGTCNEAYRALGRTSCSRGSSDFATFTQPQMLTTPSQYAPDALSAL